MEHENLLSPDEKAVYKFLAGRSESRSSIVEKTGFGKTKVIGILKKLESEGYVRSSGNGRGTRYSAA